MAQSGERLGDQERLGRLLHLESFHGAPLSMGHAPSNIGRGDKNSWVTRFSTAQGIRLYTHPAQDGAPFDNQM